MRLATLLLALALPFASVGCVAPEGDDIGMESADATSTNIDYEVWEEPVFISTDEAVSGEVAYKQCEQVEPEEGVDIAIECGQAWAEVAWYVLPADELQDAIGRELSVRFETERVVRASIHSVTPDGEKTKLAVQHSLLGGDALTAPIEDNRDYAIYVARGRTLEPLWGSGTVPFTLTASIAGEPASGE
jgi:hypothetical protein